MIDLATLTEADVHHFKEILKRAHYYRNIADEHLEKGQQEDVALTERSAHLAKAGEAIEKAKAQVTLVSSLLGLDLTRSIEDQVAEIYSALDGNRRVGQQ